MTKNDELAAKISADGPTQDLREVLPGTYEDSVRKPTTGGGQSPSTVNPLGGGRSPAAAPTPDEE